MIKIERLCIDLMLSLKNGGCTKDKLDEYKETIFEMAITAVGGEKTYKKVKKILDKR